MQKVIKIMEILAPQEKKIYKIRDDLSLCIDIGANVGKYTELPLRD